MTFFAIVDVLAAVTLILFATAIDWTGPEAPIFLFRSFLGLLGACLAIQSLKLFGVL